MSLRPSLLAGCIALAACSSDVIDLADIDLKGTSFREGRMQVFFEAADGVECAGVRVRDSVGNQSMERIVSFIRDGSEPRVDIGATRTDSAVWEESLVVEFDLSHELYPGGGELTLRFEDRFGVTDGTVYGFPARD